MKKLIFISMGVICFNFILAQQPIIGGHQINISKTPWITEFKQQFWQVFQNIFGVLQDILDEQMARHNQRSLFASPLNYLRAITLVVPGWLS